MLESFKQKTEDTKNWLNKEMLSIRTGRATAAILDSVLVESYGSKVPINQVANINTEDVRTLRIVPWSPDQINSIEVAINSANLNLSVSVDEKGLRISFPELTSENRESLIKIAKSKLEESRISVKKERDEILSDIQEKEKNGEMSEDEKFKFKDDIQKIVDNTNKELEEIYQNKESEISS